MELNLLDLKGNAKGKVKLPEQFNEPVREDLIFRAVHTIQSNKRQAYGAFSEAGKKPSAKLSKRRKKFRGSYGKGISRVPRKILRKSGSNFTWQGAFAPGMVGGRRAHPPKADKIWSLAMNKKENRKAIRSALAATMSKELVAKRGHALPEKYPFVIDNELETLSKTKQVMETLASIGISDELKRSSIKKIRAGKGKNRNRKYTTKKGPLIVVSTNCALSLSGKNIPGVEVQSVKNLNAELLAPGAMPGRLTIFTKAAVELMEKEKMFSN